MSVGEVLPRRDGAGRLGDPPATVAHGSPSPSGSSCSGLRSDPGDRLALGRTTRRSPDDGPSSGDDRNGLCAWCRAAPARRKYCSRKCRQAAWRFRQRLVVEDLNDEPKRMAYADPPYPGMAAKFYKGEASFAGEVDHEALISSLLEERYDGWALSTSSKALRDILPLCPPEARVCAWVKPIGASVRTFGIHSTWEPVIVVPGREERPGKRDWLSAQPARFGGSLPGRKPIAFCAWLFGLLGMRAGDELVDLFPGTGIVGRAWSEASARARDDSY